MRLTLRLCRQNHRFIFKQLWKQKQKIKLQEPELPLAAQEPGVKIVDPNELYNNNEIQVVPWEPVVPDDPQFAQKPLDKDHPDYHDEFVYDYNMRTSLLEGDKQACLVTKTQMFNGLPKKIQNLVGAVEIPDQDELMQRYIMQAHKWDTTKEKLPRRINKQLPGWRFKAEWGIPLHRQGTILLDNIVRLCRGLAGSYPDLAVSRRFAKEPHVSTFFKFQDKPVQVRGQGEWFVTSDRPLPPFASEEVVDASVAYKIPYVYPLSPLIDFRHEHIWRHENITGQTPSFSHSYPHTLLMRENPVRAVSRRNAHMIMYCFAHCVAFAKQKYGWEVKKLPEPIMMQMVTSDGSNFNFACYQLNTMQLDNLDGIKNFVWIDADRKMFNKILPKRAMLRHTQYEDYDPQVFRTLLAMYVNGADLTPGRLMNPVPDSERVTQSAGV